MVAFTIPAAAVKPAIELATTGAIHGWRWVRRYFSPTILIAGPHNAGKTTLSEYFRLGAFPPREASMDETQDFESRLVEMVFKRGTGTQTSHTFWIRDSRGFFDADPLVKDVEYVCPVFIFFVFDIKKIDDGTGIPTMKYEFVENWIEKFTERVQEHIAVNSGAKLRLCGAAVLINKCDTVDESTFRDKQTLFDVRIKPQFRTLQPLLGFGDQRFQVFYTSMMDGRLLPRPARPESDFQWAMEFMFRMLDAGRALR